MGDLLPQLVVVLAPHCRVKDDSVQVSQAGLNALASMSAPVGGSAVRLRCPKKAAGNG